MTHRGFLIGALFTATLWLGSAAVAHASYPATFTIEVDQEDPGVVLTGTGSDTGESTVIALPSAATTVQARKLRASNTNYVGVLYQKGRGIYLRLYHPNGNTLTQRTVLNRKSDQAFPSVRLTSVVSKNRRLAKVTAIKQTAAGINKRFILKRYQVKPKQTGTKKLTVERSQVEVITAPTFTGDNWLAMLNYYRKASGLTPVKENSGLSDDCELHNRYMEINSVLTHFEQEDKPGYTEAGARAGLNSVITSWWSNQKRDAVTGWYDTLYHRLPLLNPAMDAPGFDAEFQTNVVSYYCLYYATYDTQLSDIAYEPTAWPFPGMTNVEPSLDINESPDPLEPHQDENADWPTGPIVTLQFHNGETVTRMEVSFIRSGDGNVEGYTQLPNDSDSPNNLVQGNTVSFIPKNPLQDNTAYTVTMSGTVDGEAFTKTWDFTTGS